MFVVCAGRGSMAWRELITLIVRRPVAFRIR
jgi:hypothetical protein